MTNVFTSHLFYYSPVFYYPNKPASFDNSNIFLQEKTKDSNPKPYIKEGQTMQWPKERKNTKGQTIIHKHYAEN